MAAPEPSLATIVLMLQQLQKQVDFLQSETSTLRAQNNLILQQTNSNKRFLTQLRDLPFEIAARIFAFISPEKVFKYRRLVEYFVDLLCGPQPNQLRIQSKSINAVLLSSFFAAISVLNHAAPLPSVSKRHLNIKPSPIDKAWFLVPKNYQIAYSEARFKQLETLQWFSINWSAYKPKTLSTREMRDAPFNQLIQMGLAIHRDGRVRRQKPAPLLIYIPDAISCLTNLKTLQLSTCELSGPIPQCIGSLRSLESLNLGDNKLQGPIPEELGQLVALKELNLYGQHLDGNINVLAPLTSLQKLNLHQNSFSGEISVLSELGNLNQVFLSNNSFEGPIPNDIGTRVPNLSIVNASGNKLSGSIPASIGLLSRLECISLDDNRLSGPIPVELGNLPALGALHLSKNELSGEIPIEICNLATLWELYLDQNRLVGPIPPMIHQLVELRSLTLSSNNLTGDIPETIYSMQNLEAIDLSNNSLSGSLSAQVGNLAPTLKILKLSQNKFQGEIPDAICDLRILEVLGLADNMFTGKLPSRLGALYLDSLELKGNQVDTGIPSSILRDSALFGLLVKEGFGPE